MSTLWVVPMVVLAAGTVAVASAVRGVATALADLREGLQAFGEVGAAVETLRHDVATLSSPVVRRTAE